jgi:PTH1 family peptidyl-tRNA hydrolase
MSITLVAGLGNPGRSYAHSRHNVGWIVVEALARKHRLAWQANGAFEAELARWEGAPSGTRWLMKPTTFMNESGRSVGALARFHKVPASSVVAVYDDLTIELGRLKVSVTGSAGGHNGVSSLLEHVGDGFVRYRIGIGPKEPTEMDLKDFVLNKFTAEQLAIIHQKLDHYVQGLELLLDRGAEQAMNQLNRKIS